MHFPKSYTYFQRKYLAFTTWLSVREAKKIIVPSNATKDDLMTSFACPSEKIAVVPHGIDAPPEVAHGRDREILREFGLDPGSRYIFYVGRLEAKKNLMRLVRAFAKFRKQFPEWRLILAGNRGCKFEDLFQEVENLTLWDSVMMPGYVTDEERGVLLRHCQFTAFISLAEGFGFPVLEAAGSGKRVLASDIAALREVGGDQLTYVNPFDENNIFERMSEMARKDGSADTDDLKKLARKYSWYNAGRSTLRVLESVL